MTSTRRGFFQTLTAGFAVAFGVKPRVREWAMNTTVPTNSGQIVAEAWERYITAQPSVIESTTFAFWRNRDQ